MSVRNYCKVFFSHKLSNDVQFSTTKAKVVKGDAFDRTDEFGASHSRVVNFRMSSFPDTKKASGLNAFIHCSIFNYAVSAWHCDDFVVDTHCRCVRRGFMADKTQL